MLRWPDLIVGGFFAALVLLGVWLHRDYGVSWDEPMDRLIGLLNLKYAAQRLAPALARQEANFPAGADLMTYSERDHGPIFDMGLGVLGRLLTHGDTRAFYFLRHLCTYFIFVGGVWSIYHLALLRFRDWRWALLAGTLLVLSPRFFAEAFYNSKDVVFMAAFALSQYTLVRLLHKPGYATAAVHGLTTALAVDVRVMGLLVVAFTLGMLALEWLYAAADARSRLLRVAGVYTVIAAVCTVALWPFLWEAPLAGLRFAFTRFSKFPWPGRNFYLGQLITGPQTPWHYPLVWIVITAPVPYIAMALLGTLGWATGAWRSQLRSLRHFTGRIDLLMLGWLFMPIALVWVYDAVIYNGWRHLYFIYPALLLLAVRGAQTLVQISHGSRPIWRRIALLALVIAGFETSRTAWRMISMHPHEQVYFSFLPGATAGRLFDRDYWGLSYKQGLEWILAHDQRSSITFDSEEGIPCSNNLMLLRPEQRARLRYAPRAEADYFLTTYYYHPQSYLDSLGPVVHSIQVEELVVLDIFSPKGKQPTRGLTKTQHIENASGTSVD